ncbi:MAG: hypothetical protein DCF20_04085 [Pseudanabaena sp.]|nr:MAG: hypothetical protein DCF20_04085 [Pseudanabaena sp.]
MRVFIDCTHTANYTYKNTCIHRIVRQITLELLEIAAGDSNLEVIPVKFDGDFIIKVNSLDEEKINCDPQDDKEIDLARKLAKKMFISKVKNKLKKLFSNYLILNKDMNNPEFAGIKFSSTDIYLIADANWDLPRSYHRFLQQLKKRKVNFGSDSAAGSLFISRLLTVVSSLSLQKRNILDFLAESVSAARSGRIPPSLLSPDYL